MNSSSIEEKLSQSLFPGWAKPVPGIGKGVYQLTSGPKEHKHTYYLHSPWSNDGKKILLFRYDRENPEGEVCLLDLETEQMQTIGKKHILAKSLGSRAAVAGKPAKSALSGRG